MVKFQMVGSDSPRTIAEVHNDGDIESFRKDAGWFELKEEQKKEVPVKETPVKKSASSKKEAK